jgi:hypothetical protein
MSLARVRAGTMRLILFSSAIAVAAACRDKGASPEAASAPGTSMPASASAGTSRVRLDRNNVPDDLRDLVPLAEKWGIGDDVERSEFQAAASAEEKAQLSAALKGRNQRITQWLDSFADGAAMSDEAAAFMYMQLALDEMGLWQQ